MTLPAPRRSIQNSLAVRLVRGRPRMAIAILAGVFAYFLLPGAPSALTRAILAWDVGCLLFLVLWAQLASSERDIARDAAAQEEGEWTIFSITLAGIVASFAALLGEFSHAKDLQPASRGLEAGLVAATLLLSWLATHAVFALRYAHEYYGLDESGAKIGKGLEFPGTDTPDYWDFGYFALVLGMTFQVSDVQITSGTLRRLAALHGFLGFLFNTVLVALTVNIAAGMM